MGEILRSPLSLFITLNGMPSLHNLYNQTSPGNTIFRHQVYQWSHRLSDINTNRRRSQSNLRFGFIKTARFLILLNAYDTVETGYICTEGEGNSVINQDLFFNSNAVSQSSTICENRVHFLEERDEEVLSKRILSLSRSNKITSALELYWSMEFSGLLPNTHSCNSLISCLLRNNNLDDAMPIFESMKRNEIATGHTYSLMLKAVATAHGCGSALKLFTELELDCKRKNSFDAIVYNTILSACGKVNNWVQTERIWKSMKENGLDGTDITYRLLVSTFCRCGQNELTFSAYSEMIQNGLKPDEDTVLAVISSCTKEGQWDLALSIFKNSLKNGINPNLIACNTLINSIGKAGEVELAFKVYALMKSLGHKPDMYTWNALLGSLYRANRYSDTLLLFERIKKDQATELNLHLYESALRACQKLGLWDKALQLLWEMEASKFSIVASSYNLVIGACEVARKPKVALQVYEHMIYRKCLPDTFTHLSLIRSCIWASLWHEVEEILDRNPPNVSLYNAVIHGMCLRGKTEPAKKLYLRMQKLGLKPDGKTRALVLQNLQRDSTEQRKQRYFRHKKYTK